MFYTKHNFKINYLNNDLTIKKHTTLYLENITLTINKFNCLIKGYNGAGKSMLGVDLFNTFYIFKKIKLSYYYLFLFNYYYSYNYYYFNYINYNINFTKLSFGNKQLFVFILNNFLIRKLYFFDEITNGLDKNNTKLFKYLLTNLIMSNKKLIFISHYSLIKLKNTLIYL